MRFDGNVVECSNRITTNSQLHVTNIHLFNTYVVGVVHVVEGWRYLTKKIVGYPLLNISCADTLLHVLHLLQNRKCLMHSMIARIKCSRRVTTNYYIGEEK